jgi:cobalt-zinc-cadmium resistance protein CzcA
MLTALIDLSLNNRFLVIALVGLMAIGGAYSALKLPIDAVPDMTNTQVTVVTEATTLSPLEIERYITYPVEQVMSGLPHVQEVRSVSKFGVSVVTIVFEEHVPIATARQLVNERLAQARSAVSSQHGVPQLGPLTTALGEIMQFEVKSDRHTPMQLRSLLEWTISPQLREVPGVTEINAHGGYYKTFEVRLDPEKLATSGISLGQVTAALEKNNLTAGGGYAIYRNEQRFIRGQSLLTNTHDIEQVVVDSHPGGLPVLVRDLGEVMIAPMTRQGCVTRDGRGEVVTGMVMMMIGANSRTVVHDAKARLAQIEKTLPPGVQCEVIYDRSELIDRTLHTVEKNLFEGGIFVIVVLLILLGSVRAGAVVALAIPLSMLFAANIMSATAITASLMSLGAIDFGLIVDSSVIMIENCMRRLALPHAGRTHLQVIRDAAIEVRKPTMFGELIIAVVYLPILALQGTEGKLFRPMALTVLFALAGSLVLSMTLMPVLAYMALPKKLEEKEVWFIRAVKWLYRPALAIAVKRPVFTAAVALGLFLVTLPIAMNLGAEFMPRLDEGDILVEANRLPSATLEDAVPMSTQVERLLKEFPEVKTVFCKTGRPEIANDVMGVQQTDVWVMLNDVKTWPKYKTRDELIEEMSEVLNSRVPGTSFGFTQPIEMRVDELVAGVKADVAVLLYGDDMGVLVERSKDIERLLKTIPGAVDVKADIQSNIPSLTISPRPEQLARYGLPAQDVMQSVSALGGIEVGDVFEGRARYPIIVRYPESWRNSEERIEQLPVTMLAGAPLPLGEVADLDKAETPPGIEHESNRRRTFIACNVRGRDVASFVQEAQAKVEQQIKLPVGYSVRWGGDFENLQSASLRLAIITPIVLLVIWLLLYTTFKSSRLALLIFIAVPVAASGGIIALAVRGMPFSISAGVGFIALFGVAVLNGLVWVSGAEHLREAGWGLKAASHETALVRIRPVLMTAMVASLGFLPMALSTTAGAEIQRPLASVVIGGLITSTLLTALVVPAIYPWFAPKHGREDVEPDYVPPSAELEHAHV